MEKVEQRLAAIKPRDLCRIMFTSGTIPHVEGLAEPGEYLKEFSTYNDSELKNVFHSNM